MFKKMKYLLVAAAMLVSSSAVFAETSMFTSSIDVSASVLTTSLILPQILNISNDLENTAIAFGSVNSDALAWANQPAQYIKLTVTDNSAAWRLRAYSDNYTEAPATSTWGYQYGGLRGAVDGAKIPMGWLVNKTVLAGGPVLGNPSLGVTNGWTFLKDIHDVRDPLFTNPDGTPGDNSFAAADLAGYTNIAFGGAAYTNIVRPNVSTGSESLATPTTPFYMYLEGSFNAAVATSYTGALKLELINL